MHIEPLLAAALAIGFYMAWNIGANDVANAFGTSVGSGALTFRQAMLIAAVFEFAGAFFAGSHVANTIRGDIVRPEVFAAMPDHFEKGMLAALLAASLWLHIATFLGQPVSTTHAIIGAVIGFGVAAAGPSCVQWYKMGRIASSWFISPVVGGIGGFLIYSAIRKFILRSDRPSERARSWLPYGIGLVSFIILYTCLPTLFRRYAATHPGAAGSPALVPGVSLGLAAVIVLAVRFHLRRHGIPPPGTGEEQYALVEKRFTYLQIMTACYMSFAHGANDVANAIGPISGILAAMRGEIGVHAAVPLWLLAFGGAGIVVGLAMYGRRVVEAIGKKITEVTPTRGHAAELSTASTVLVCSLMGLPISTTFVLVGAVMGVGLARGFGAIDLGVVKKIFLSWVVTIPISAVLSAILFKLLLAAFP